MPVIDYVIITSHDLSLLTEQVLDLLGAAEQWQPLGGPFVKEAGGIEYHQAMVREGVV
jgi:hypothetical protein